MWPYSVSFQGESCIYIAAETRVSLFTCAQNGALPLYHMLPSNTMAQSWRQINHYLNLFWLRDQRVWRMWQWRRMRQRSHQLWRFVTLRAPDVSLLRVHFYNSRPSDISRTLASVGAQPRRPAAIDDGAEVPPDLRLPIIRQSVFISSQYPFTERRNSFFSLGERVNVNEKPRRRCGPATSR